MLDGIRVMNKIILTMVKEHVLNTMMGDWLGATSYMSTKVAVQFLPCLNGKWKARGDNNPVISCKLETADVVEEGAADAITMAMDAEDVVVMEAAAATIPK